MVECYEVGNAQYGVFHYCGDEETTWCDFARCVFKQAEECGYSGNSPVVNAITTDDYPTPAARPAYSVMNSGKLASAFGIDANDWRNSLNKVLRELASQE